MAIAIIGLLLLFLISTFYIHKKLLPLTMLTEQAQRIADGNLDEPIPDSRREDEIGRLQDNFKLMQQSLATNIGELDQLTNQLKEHGKELSIAYREAQKADRMKTAFLHNMTNQMIEPAESISKDVNTLCDRNRKTEGQDIKCLADDIQKNGNAIAELLKNLINMSDEDIRKEVQDASRNKEVILCKTQSWHSANGHYHIRGFARYIIHPITSHHPHRSCRTCQCRTQHHYAETHT
jgi:methyl-accepting chemotaxis protein